MEPPGTYDLGYDDSSDLFQGDILSPTPELKELLETFQPHFAKTQQLGFIVCTQTCDMVRRSGSASARYISIAPIRSLHEVLPTLLKDHVGEALPGAFPQERKAKARELLARIFNQNEWALGLLYLHPERALGLGEDGVAFLRVMFPLRSLHYNTLTGARIGRLRPPFSEKLGWLVGNLYSRVGTPDWPKKDLEKLIDKFVNDPEKRFVWADEARVKEAEQRLAAEDAPTPMRVQELLATIKLPSAVEVAAEEVARAVSTLFEFDADAQLTLKDYLKNDPSFKSRVKS